MRVQVLGESRALMYVSCAKEISDGETNGAHFGKDINLTLYIILHTLYYLTLYIILHSNYITCIISLKIRMHTITLRQVK